MKVSIDQGLTITALIVWRGREIAEKMVCKKSFPKHFTKEMTLEKCRFRWKEIEEYLIQVILRYQPESITEIILEEFVKYIPIERQESLVKLNIFTGYLLGKLEGFGGASPKVYQVNKGTMKKADVKLYVMKRFNLPDGLESDIYDACYHGVLAGADR
jgi:hypothetical protein